MIVFLLVFIAGMCNAVMDTIAHKGGGVLPESSWWSMELSWMNKWKNGDPKQGEAFFLSSTALVFLTDAWHFFQFLMLTLFALCIGLGSPFIWWVTLIGAKVCFSVGFEIFWRLLNKDI